MTKQANNTKDKQYKPAILAPRQPRIHKTVVSFNDREMALVDQFCEKYHIQSRSKMYREAIISTILRTMEEDHPRLF